MAFWNPIFKLKPPEFKLVMVCGDSGYSLHMQFIALAYYNNDYRPPLDGRIRWLDVTGTALSDYGWVPSHWAWPIGLPPLTQTVHSWRDERLVIFKKES